MITTRRPAINRQGLLCTTIAPGVLHLMNTWDKWNADWVEWYKSEYYGHLHPPRRCIIYPQSALLHSAHMNWVKKEAARIRAEEAPDAI